MKPPTNTAPRMINNRYRLVKNLGSGGMGEVWLVHDTLHDDKPLALKKLLGNSFSPSDQLLAEFLKLEFATLSRLQHPHLAQVFDFGVDQSGGGYFFTSEFVDGTDLTSFFKQHPKSTLLLQAVVAIAQVLDYLHSRGYLHLDIKPNNFLVVEKNGEIQLKLVDFGAARSIQQARDHRLAGTPKYMAPELLQGKEVDNRVDLYALGITIQTLIEGCFSGQPSSELRCLSSIAEQLSHQEPMRRLHRAREVIQQINRALTTAFPLQSPLAQISVVHTPFMIDREKELEQATQFIGKAVRHNGCILLEGESGVGKTRFISELRQQLQLKQVLCFQVTCGTTESAFQQLIRFLLTTLGNQPPHNFFQNHSDENTVGEALFDLCHQVSRMHPLLICLDDLHLADYFDTQMFKYLARSLTAEQTAQGWALLGSFIPSKTTAAAYHRLRDDITGAQLLHLSLHNFAQTQQVDAFLAAVFGNDVQLESGFSKELFELSGGNPLYLEELLKSWLAHFDDSTKIEFTLTSLKKAALPKTLRSLLERTFAELPSQERLCLEQMALLQQPIPLEICRHISGTKETQQSILQNIFTRRLLLQEFTVERQVVVRFEKDSFRRLILRQLSVARSKTLHAEIAVKLQMHFDKQAMQHADQLAYHYLAANDFKAAAPYVTSGVALLRQRFAIDPAIDLIRLQLDLEKNRHRRLPLLQTLADLLMQMGRNEEAKNTFDVILNIDKKNIAAYLGKIELCKKIGNYKEMTLLLERAKKLASHDDDLLTLQLQNIDLKLLSGGHEEAITLAKKLLNETPLDNQVAQQLTLARLYSNIGLASFYLHNYSEALKWLPQALKIARQIDSPNEQISILYRLGVTYLRNRQYAEALQFLQQAKDLARATASQKQLQNININLGTLYLEQNDIQAALHSYTEGLKIANRLEDYQNKTISSFNLATLYHFLADYEQAQLFLTTALNTSAQMQQHYYYAYGHLLQGAIQTDLGHYDVGRRTLVKAMQLMRRLGKQGDISHCLLELGRWHLLQKKSRQTLGYVKRVQKHLKLNPQPRLSAQANLLAAQAIEPTKTELTQETAILESSLDDLQDDANFESRDLVWKIMLYLAELYQKSGESARSQHFLRLSNEELQRLIQALPKAYQRSFVDAPPRQTLLKKLETSRALLTKSDLRESSIAELSRVILSERDKMLPILEISRKLNSLLDLKSLLDFIMDMMMNLTGAKHGYLLIAEANSFETFASRNLTDEESRASHSIARMVMKQGTPLITHDALQDERLESFKTVVDLKLKSILCLPFRLRDQIIGVLYLEHRTRSNAFNADIVTIIEAIADQAAIAIHNARLHSATVEQEKEIRQLNRRLQAELADEKQRLAEAERLLNSQQQGLIVKYRSHNIITRSKKMRAVLELIEKVGQSDAAILIQGESGTGKELIARALHYSGKRQLRAFMTVNCSALTESLLESELFGHEKGAFTGAARLKKGLFEMADGGTLFLDEVGDMSLTMQVKLLRVLQEGEIRRVGSQQNIQIDVRIVSATNLDIQKRVKEGKFREDLFYRLNTIQIDVPPLRQRREDIPLLVRHILSQSTKPQIVVSPAAQDMLDRHSWPGNVRELENELQRALIFADKEILPTHLSSTLQRAQSQNQRLLGTTLQETIKGKSLDQVMGQLEKEVLETALQMNDGRKGTTAEKLRVTRFTLYRKLKEHGLAQDESDDNSEKSHPISTKLLK